MVWRGLKRVSIQRSFNIIKVYGLFHKKTRIRIDFLITSSTYTPLHNKSFNESYDANLMQYLDLVKYCLTDSCHNSISDFYSKRQDKITTTVTNTRVIAIEVPKAVVLPPINQNGSVNNYLSFAFSYFLVEKQIVFRLVTISS